MAYVRTQMVKYVLLVILTLGLYSVARLEFFLWHVTPLSQRGLWEILWAFVVGMRFDGAAVAYLSMPPLLLSLLPWGRLPLSLRQQNLGQWAVFVGCHTPLAVLNLVDTAYVDFVGSRFTWETLFLFGEVQGKLWSFLTPFLGLVGANTLLLLTYLWLCWQALQRLDVMLARQRRTVQEPAWVRVAWQNGALALLTVAAVVVAARGVFPSPPGAAAGGYGAGGGAD